MKHIHRLNARRVLKYSVGGVQPPDGSIRGGGNAGKSLRDRSPGSIDPVVLVDLSIAFHSPDVGAGAHSNLREGSRHLLEHAGGWLKVIHRLVRVDSPDIAIGSYGDRNERTRHLLE